MSAESPPSAAARRALEPPPAREGPLIRSVFFLYLAVDLVARSLPEPIAYGFTHWAARVKLRFTRRQARVVAANLQRVTGLPPTSPRLRALVVGAYESYGRYWLETFRYARRGAAFFQERFTLEGREHLDAALAQGRGAVVAIPHCGNYDAAGAYMAAEGYRPVTVAEVLRPRRLYRFFVDHRESLGMVIYPAVRGITAKLVEECRAGSLVAILGDRDLRGDGPQVSFFGAPTTLPGGAASVALRAQAPLLVAAVHSRRLPDGRWGWVGTVTEPIPVPPARGREAVTRLTQEVARRLETLIAAHPEEWHVFTPLWARPEGVG